MIWIEFWKYLSKVSLGDQFPQIPTMPQIFPEGLVFEPGESDSPADLNNYTMLGNKKIPLFLENNAFLVGYQ